MNWRQKSKIEHLERRTLFSAHAFISGKTLEVDADPQTPSSIDVEYGDPSKRTISVTIYTLTNGEISQIFNPHDLSLDFPAAKVKLVWVRASSGDDTIKVGDISSLNGQSMAFNINTRVDTLDGNNTVWAGDENITVNGGAGNDTFVAGNGNDILRGGAGDDYLSVGNGKDEISGGDGNDRIIGGNGRETITGGAGNDSIWVTDQAHGGDLVFGGAGDDSISCGNGNDTIWGGAGNDVMGAGYGNDVFGVGIGSDYAVNDGNATFYSPNIAADRTSYDPTFDKLIKTVSKNETKDPVI